MPLRSGIPTLTDVDELLTSDLYRAHREANAAFLKQHGPVLGRYARAWGADPVVHWSRRWEYPYAASHVLEFGRQFEHRAFRLLDAGSGVTYLPQYVAQQLPNAQITCCDYNAAYGKLFADIASGGGSDRVSFVSGSLQQIPMGDKSVDAVACVSVLEHTSGYEKIIDEFARVLAPGGLLVLTFDIGLDLKFEILPENCRALLDTIRSKFEPQGGVDWQAELRKIDQPAGLLTTDAYRKTQPELLPWKHKVAQTAYDFLRGKGWTGGFRSVAPFCLAATLRG